MSDPEQPAGGRTIDPHAIPGRPPGEPVGHGTIRLRGRADGPAPGAVVAAPAEPVGHGTIRLHGQSVGPAVEENPRAADVFDPIADILAALAATA
jgi:hypothetical protein